MHVLHKDVKWERLGENKERTGVVKYEVSQRLDGHTNNHKHNGLLLASLQLTYDNVFGCLGVNKQFIKASVGNNFLA